MLLWYTCYTNTVLTSIISHNGGSEDGDDEVTRDKANSLTGFEYSSDKISAK